MTYETLFAREGSKGQRREYRRDVRRLLGTSSDPAPDAHDTLDAARHLSMLLDDATSGRFRLTVERRDGSKVRITDALAELRAEREAGRAR